MLYNYLLIALRNLKKNVTLSLINISGLAIGISVALLILNYVANEFSYDKFHKNVDQIYRVESNFHEGKVLTDDWPTASFGYGPAMKANIPGIKDYVRIALHQVNQVVKFENIKFRENTVCYTEPSFFRIFSFELLSGDQRTALERPNSVVLTETAAHRYFGDQNPIGKMMSFSTTEHTDNCEVTGVLKDLPQNSHFQCEFFISFSTLPQWIKEFWYLHETYTYVQLSPGISTSSIESRFPAMAEKYKTQPALKNKIWGVSLVPLKDIHLNPQKSYERETKGNRKAVIALIIIAIAILIIAWINYVNLTIARSMERAKEVGIRKISGAEKKQLIVQFLFESFIINMIALVLSFFLLSLFIPEFNHLTGKFLSFSVWFTSYFWIILVLVFLVGVVLSGFYPAFVLSSITPTSILKGKYIHSNGAGLIRKILVVFQFSASFILICGTLVVNAQLRFMKSQDLGVNVDQTLVLRYPVFSEKLTEKVLSFKKALYQYSWVKDATISGSVPGVSIDAWASNHRQDDTELQNRLYEMLPVDYDYLSAYGLKVIEGRSFNEAYGGDREKLVINEEAAKLLNFKSAKEALGGLVMIEGESVPVEIIGVVKNFHHQSLQRNYTPIMFILYNRVSWLKLKYISIKMNSADIQSHTEAVERLWKGYFPESTFDSFFLNEFFDRQYKEDRNFGYIFGIFSLIAIIIASIGLWALALYTANSRTKEMGIRKVNGASVYDLFMLLAKEFIVLIALAIVIATPLSWYIMSEWLKGYAFRTTISPWFFVLASLILMLISLLAIGRRIYKTATSNPVESLKYE
ncbi:MAG: ABC transporter permease [Bacteroidetes bacterium]|nr:ABC transporter permease [Bacteroidota bacterium]